MITSIFLFMWLFCLKIQRQIIRSGSLFCLKRPLICHKGLLTLRYNSNSKYLWTQSETVCQTCTQSHPIPACRQWGLLTLPVKLQVIVHELPVFSAAAMFPATKPLLLLATGLTASAHQVIPPESTCNITIEDIVESCSDFQTGLRFAIQIVDNYFAHHWHVFLIWNMVSTTCDFF